MKSVYDYLLSFPEYLYAKSLPPIQAALPSTAWFGPE
jgi:hypothetical protein